MTVITVTLPTTGFVPPHTHAEEEEGYFVLEGCMTMFLGESEFEVRTGDFVHVPPGTAHGYRNDGPEPCRFLAWTVGGEIDRFFVEMSEKIRNIPEDLPRMPEILSKYGIRMTESP
jgi:mannose-6-phosphate isomerase-like protein (cupin superfamily)